MPIPLVARVGAMLAMREAGLWMARVEDRARLYACAKHRAKELKRPLVVIGDPKGGFTHTTQHGDLCIDLTGCPASGQGVKVDIGKEKLPLVDDSSVIYVSCVLEYVPDIKRAWKEIQRAAGSSSNIFVCHVRRGSLASRLYPGAKHIIDVAPPAFPELRYTSIARAGVYPPVPGGYHG